MSNTCNPSRLPRQRGQGMIEYLIIVGLIAIAVIGAYSFFSQNELQPPTGAKQESPAKGAGTDGAGGKAAAGQPAPPPAAPAGDSKGTGTAK